MVKMWHSAPGMRWIANIASLVAYIQQMDEQYALRWSRDPTHCSQAIFFGACPSEGRITIPSVGPEREASRSYCIEVMTFLCRPRPSSGIDRASNG